MKIHTSESPETEAKEGLEKLLIDHKESPVLLLLSGGSAFKVLEEISEESLGSHITIGVLDERFSADAAINNFAQLQKTDFYKKAKAAGCQVIDTSVTEEDTIENAVQFYVDELQQWFLAHPEGYVIATMGMGPDGHTSGVLPFTDDPSVFDGLFEQPWVVGYEVPPEINEYTIRMTTTLAFIRESIDAAVVLIKGKEKEGALEKMLDSKGSIHITPARIFHEMKEVDIYTDITL